MVIGNIKIKNLKVRVSIIEKIKEFVMFPLDLFFLFFF